jgi:hypothetical protein
VTDLCQEASPANAKDLRDQLRRIQTSILEQLTTALRDLPTAVASKEVLAEPGRSEWEQLVELMKDLPDRVSVHLCEPKIDQPIDPRAGVLAIDLREIAEDAMAPPWPEQLKEHTKPLQMRVVQVWSDAEQVRDIVQYNLGSAVDELENAIASGSDPEELTAAIETARELAPDGTRRSVVTLNELVQSLAEPWHALSNRAFGAIHEDWEDLLKHIRADQVLTARWVQVQTRIARLIERQIRSLQHLTTRAVARLGSWVSIVYRRTMQLIRRGQSAVGVSEPDQAEPVHTLDAIVGIDELLKTRPLVYRRLFSFAPVEDASLLEGRARDLVRARKHFFAWRDTQAPGVVILPAPLGSGRTSFLNVVQSKVLEECTARTVSLTNRLSDTSAFAAVIADALGIEGEAASSLDHLEAHLVNRARTTPPTACMIDDLEHVLLQSPGGTALLQRVLVFFSRTDTSVYWIATIARQAWHFFTKTGGAAAQLVTAYPLERLDRDVLRDIVNNRHGRTGLPLRFATRSDLSPILRQRLRRARVESKKQALLRDWYFESLHRESGEDIMLAMFYWLRSADFAAEETLTIEPIDALSFRFLTH